MMTKITKRKHGDNITINKINNKPNNNNDNQMNEHLSNERTFLSWTRTGLNIFTIGCAIGRFGGSNTSQTASLSSPNAQKKPLIAGIILAIIGNICLIYGLWRFFRTHRLIKHKRLSQAPEMKGPIFSVVLLMAILIAVIIILFII